MAKDDLVSAHDRDMAFQHLNRQVRDYTYFEKTERPKEGWIKAIRTTLGMSLQQLADRLGITRQSVMEIEQRESKGSISLNTLKEVAHALDMQLVYGFAPKDGSLEGLIIRRSNELAARIVARNLEEFGPADSKATALRIQQAIRETSLALQEEIPKILWDKDWEVLPAVEG